jgi:endonuclease/exonuclease/phosphatase (EEP) superfamily protein YafD
VVEWGREKFFISTVVRQLDTSNIWSFFMVYGPTDHHRRSEFLEELATTISVCPHPLVVVGDFNLITGADDKNNNNMNWPRAHRFNDCLASLTLREIKRVGARYTWTNKQINPVRCVLDRVFVSTDWEILFSLMAETIISSDHSALTLSSGEELMKRNPRFFFEKGWLERPEFWDLVTLKWRELDLTS